MMENLLYGAALLVLMITLLASGLWVALSLIAVGIVGLLWADNQALSLVMATSAWGTVANWGLIALPLFVWVGEILHRTKLAEDLFKGLSPLLQRFPGGLLHVNIISCGLFSAVSGSSAATAATVGKMTLPALRERGYSDRLILGTLAGSGTLGLLIPPSIILIVYGIAAEVSITRLFAAGVIPGVMVLCLFMAYVVIRTVLNDRRTRALRATQLSDIPKVPHEPLTLAVLWQSFCALLPITLMIFSVLGGIYMGWLTPTEAAAFAVLFSLGISALSGTLTKQTFYLSLIGTVKTTSMIILILVSASFLTMSMGFLNIPTTLASIVERMQLSAGWLIFALTIMFVLLGFFLDGISVVLLTTAIVLPMVQASGIDLLWFGIYLVLVVEMAQITPPVGFNLFILQSMSGKNILSIALAALPFFFLLLLALLLIWLVPDIVTWLPYRIYH